MENGMFVGVNDKALRVERAYVGVDGIANEIIKGYIGVAGKARPFYAPGGGGG